MPAKFFDWLSKLRPRQLLMLAGGAAIFIFVLMFLALSMVSKSAVENPVVEEEKPPPEPEKVMVEVVVAKRNIEPKVMIRSDMLELKEFAEDTIPSDAFRKISDVVDKPARAKIFRGDMLTAQKVYRDMAQAGFVQSIPPDCRAVSVGINDVTGVAGFAKPGDHVDVLLVERGDNSATTSIILQNVLLLSINKNMGIYDNPNNEDGAVNYSATAIENPALATLALRPEEVMKLISASKLGEIYLMLRPLVAEESYTDYTEYRVNSAKISKPEPKPAAAAEETPPPEPPKIKIIYGDD